MVQILGVKRHRPAALAQHVQCDVDGNARHPGRQRCTPLKIPQPGEGAQVGFLHYVLRLGVVEDNPARCAKQHPVMAPHDGFKGALLSLQSARHQLFVGARGGNGRLSVG